MFVKYILSNEKIMRGKMENFANLISQGLFKKTYEKSMIPAKPILQAVKKTGELDSRPNFPNENETVHNAKFAKANKINIKKLLICDYFYHLD